MTVGRIPSVEGGIQPTLLDAKGDLIAASAADTPQRLAVGSNDQVLTADSSTATGLKWATPSSTPTFVGCSLWKSANQSLATSTTTTITWDSESFDTNGFHDNSTNNSRITIPTGYAGKYLIICNLNYGSNATGYRESTIKKNGSVFLAYTGMDSGGYQSTPNSTIANLSVGDYIEITGYQTSGGNLNVAGGAASESFYQITYLGA